MSEEIFALDLGTTKFCIAPIDSSGDAIEPLCMPAKGMYKGMLSDMSEAKKALNQLVEAAEKRFSRDISKVAVGVAGSHLKGYEFSTSLSIKDETIDFYLLKQLEQKVFQQILPQQVEMIHAIPIKYTIDDRSPTLNPLGLSGTKIAGNYFIIEASKHYLKDLISLCNGIGLEISSFIAEPYASSASCLKEEIKAIGVLVADIGGGTTDCLAYIDNQPAKLFTINIGGQIITKDLSIGLGLSYLEAEKLKILWGLDYDHTQLSYADVLSINEEVKKISSRDVIRILAPRIEELAYLIDKNIKDIRTQIPAGVILTGGSSKISGLSSFLAHVLKMNVQKAKLDPFKHHEFDFNGKFSTISGMIKILNAKRLQQLKENESSFLFKWLQPISRLFKNHSSSLS